MTDLQGRERLERHYRSTTYWARTPRGAIPLRIDVPSSALAALLVEYAAVDWVFLTARNPRSEKRQAGENDAAQRRLLQRLRPYGAIVFPGDGVPDGGDWGPEASYLAVGLAEERGLALAAEFGQHAILAGRSGAPVRLLWSSA